jgi:hypothetical protein
MITKFGATFVLCLCEPGNFVTPEPFTFCSVRLDLEADARRAGASAMAYLTIVKLQRRVWNGA